MLEHLEVDFSFLDERGSIVQLVREGYAQVNVITSKAGVFRGGHYHKENREAFYIIEGALKLEVAGVSYEFKRGDFFGIEPYDMHSFTFLEDTTLVSLYSRGVENPDGTKDMFTE